ncbi:N-acetyl-gamma-glutamyl-phosphate reductase [Aquella oligotrophica]|uniref:N-acetyl-gamma-glutamyl-phosphate reductase n=1 Tax=Aquella oligotrophica TaxID=2067065 RepID=A0A2I7N488_9NEIS|nr:N-acetyl-gamma-glutamyl-phosphate reductase [Aquella oligotrophica]AUR51274.1 N-acetyl-gamma-glutamyl-phosphate reductase [Aquella oligotrophica]
MKIKASIIGASGYTGVELIRLLNAHPNVKLQYLVSENNAGSKVGDIYPHLDTADNYSFSNPDIEAIAKNSDVVFLALPHTKSITAVSKLIEYNCKIIDLSSDFRLKNGANYQKWYQHPAASQSLLDQAVYGIPEINAANIKRATLIANPGCYPTASILGIAPLIKNQLLDIPLNHPLVIDAKSGVSGAGKTPNPHTHFCEVSNNFSAYQAGGIHRHIPEIEQELGILAGKDFTIQFTPHLIPIPRGLMATIYAPVKKNISQTEIIDCYKSFYQHQEFIKINSLPRPDLKTVIGTNNCNISLHLDQRTGYLIIISAIDNLIKGASGQAIQNMNLMFGLPETSGLTQLAIYP